MPPTLPKSIEALQSVKVELESRSSAMKQVFDQSGSKFRVDFKAGFAMVPYSQLETIRKNRKFGYTFFLSKRGIKGLESIEGAIADLKAKEAAAQKAAEAKAKKEADDAAKKAAAEKK